jgi:hypothetical protein
MAAVPVFLALIAPFLGARANLGGNFLLKQVFHGSLNKLLTPQVILAQTTSGRFLMNLK